MTAAQSAILADQLVVACDALVALIEPLSPVEWTRVPAPGVWSVSKDAEHVADGLASHLWLVRSTLGQKQPPRPSIERKRLIADRSQVDVIALLRTRTAEATTLIRNLSAEQLALTPKPPRAKLPSVSALISNLLIGHYWTHHQSITHKLRTAH